MKTDPRLKSIAQLAGEAREWIKPRVVPTPLQPVPRELVAAGPDRLLLKLENQQVTGSFKARGAAHFIARLVAEHDPAGVLTYSSGNHGRAVSEVAAAMGIAALVVAPDSIDPVKAGAIIEAGAELVQVGPTTDERKLRAEQIAAERGWVIVPPFDHEWIISGQGTLVLELIEQLGSAPDHLWVPVGGGGLSAGCAATAAIEIPECTVHHRRTGGIGGAGEIARLRSKTPSGRNSIGGGRFIAVDGGGSQLAAVTSRSSGAAPDP